MNKDSIIYIGNIKQINIGPKDIKKVLNCQLISLAQTNDFKSLYSKIISQSPSLILVEINEVNSNFLSFLLLLKSHQKTKKSRIIAIFPDKNNLDQYSDIYSFGIEYGFIVGEDKDRIISDLGSFLDSTKFKPIQYAEAQNLHIPANIKFLAKVSHLTNYELNIETSLHLKKDAIIEANPRFGEKIKLKYFKVLETNNFIPRSYFSSSAKLKILFDKDKELDFEVIGKLATQEEFSIFLDTIKPNSFLRNDPALIIDGRIETLSELISELNVNNRFIKISNSFMDFEDQLSIFLPQIICFQMESESDDMADDDCLKINGPTTFNKLIQKVKSFLNYAPFILVFNERSRSNAYRKAHNYDRIVVNKKSFELQYLSMIIDEYQQNHPSENDTLFLRPPGKSTVLEINREIIITSISENKITFLFEGELDLYSTFKISDPLNIYVTVVPTNQALETKKPYNHYLGFVSNTNEEDKMELRKLVNLLIKVEISKDETFILKSVADLREEIIKEKTTGLQKSRKLQRKKYEEDKNGSGEE